ncbi:MAG: sigma-70 family RNA polymerase sigma factor [Acidobacteriota bacterium]
MPALEARELLTSNLALIERAVAYACRRNGLGADDAEELAAIVNLKLVENDYAILDKFERRSSFATFISVVVQRMALDYRIHMWGKWHGSAEAKRLGPLAVDLDRMLYRDRRTLDEALVLLEAQHPGVTRRSLQELADRLPAHPPRLRAVRLDDAGPLAVTRGNLAEDRSMAGDRDRASQQLSTVMSTAIEQMPDDARLILQLRFEGGMAVSQIARMLKIEQKVLYRRLERLMRDLREKLERAGLSAEDILDLVGRDENPLHFDLGNRKRRPSIGADETGANNSEAPQ